MNVWRNSFGSVSIITKFVELHCLPPKLKFAKNWKGNGFSRITSKLQFIYWDMYYFSERLRCRLSIIIQTFNEFGLWKKNSGGLLCTGGAAGFWAMHFFSTTYFDEIIIFGLSKDQTFRIWCTLINPAQFWNLVTHLVGSWMSKNLENHTKLCDLQVTFQNFIDPFSSR